MHEDLVQAFSSLNPKPSRNSERDRQDKVAHVARNSALGHTTLNPELAEARNGLNLEH